MAFDLQWLTWRDLKCMQEMDPLIHMLWLSGGYLTGYMTEMKQCTIRSVNNVIPLPYVDGYNL